MDISARCPLFGLTTSFRKTAKIKLLCYHDILNKSKNSIFFVQFSWELLSNEHTLSLSLSETFLMELSSNVFFGGVVNDKCQPDVCICLAKLAELSALFLAARRNRTKFCDVISWIFPRGVLYRDSPLHAGKRPKSNYCVCSNLHYRLRTAKKVENKDRKLQREVLLAFKLEIKKSYIYGDFS